MVFDDGSYTRVRAGSVGVLIRAGHVVGPLPSVGGAWTFAGGVFAVTHPVPRTW